MSALDDALLARAIEDRRTCIEERDRLQAELDDLRDEERGAGPRRRPPESVVLADVVDRVAPSPDAPGLLTPEQLRAAVAAHDEDRPFDVGCVVCQYRAVLNPLPPTPPLDAYDAMVAEFVGVEGALSDALSRVKRALALAAQSEETPR